MRERRVPHQRTGPTKGVWFTAADVLKIGEMLPDLMAHRRDSKAGPGAGQPYGGMPAEPAQKLAEWARLTAHQRRPRRSTR